MATMNMCPGRSAPRCSAAPKRNEARCSGPLLRSHPESARRARNQRVTVVRRTPARRTEEASPGANRIEPKQRPESSMRTSTQVSPCAADQFSLGGSHCDCREPLSMSPEYCAESQSLPKRADAHDQPFPEPQTSVPTPPLSESDVTRIFYFCTSPVFNQVQRFTFPYKIELYRLFYSVEDSCWFISLIMLHESL